MARHHSWLEAPHRPHSEASVCTQQVESCGTGGKLCRVPLASAESSVNICQLGADTGVTISRYLAFGGGWCWWWWTNGDTDQPIDHWHDDGGDVCGPEAPLRGGIHPRGGQVVSTHSSSLASCIRFNMIYKLDNFKYISHRKRFP